LNKKQGDAYIRGTSNFDRAGGGTTDGLPACVVGMDLLGRFQAARPNDYAFLEVKDFADLSTSAFDGILEWDAFTEQCAKCKDCKEQLSACAER
jgi:hypothetical protein